MSRKGGAIQFNSVDAVLECILSEVENPGGIVTHVFFEKPYKGLICEYSHEIYESDFESSCSILQSLGLIRSSRIDSRYPATGDLSLYFLHLTQFGSKFLLACDRDLATLVNKSEDEAEM